MTGDARTLVAWDSCVFLAWFKREADKPLDEIENLLRAIQSDLARLLVSVICCAEVLDEAGRSDAGTQFRGFCRRRSVILANVDMRVAEKAAEYRQRVTEAVKAGKLTRGLKAPDALITATAKIYRADVLHTFDADLLALSESQLIDGVRIERPSEPIM